MANYKKYDHIMYKISVLNWEEHNGGAKKHFKYTRIKNNFCSDDKLGMLPLTHGWLFLDILLTCGEAGKNVVLMSNQHVTKTLRSSRQPQEALDALQSFQLLTYEIVKIKPSLNVLNVLNELNELNVFESDFPEKSKAPKVRDKPNSELNKKIWAAYRDAYAVRYKTEPVRNASVNGKISQLAKRLGEEAVGVVVFYLTHNDFAYVKAMHPIGLCLSHAEGLRTQWARGKAITSGDVRNFEKKNEFNNLLKDIEENGI